MASKLCKKLSTIAISALLSIMLVPAVADACNIFDWSDCDNAGKVIYCQSGQDCSLQRGTDIAAGGINDIEKDRKFSQFIQDVVAYLLLFIGIVGVLYIIYAGFNIITSGGDEEKVKTAKKTIFHVIIGVILIFLAYSIVRFVIGRNGDGGVLNNAFRLPSLIETTYAYTDYDNNTFDYYKKRIELLSANLNQEYRVNNKITTKTLGELSTLVVQSMETFPDSDNIIFNTNLARSLSTAIDLVKKEPDSDSAITELAKALNDYLTKIKISRIKGLITASPDSGNAPLEVTLRAQDMRDPSGVTIPKGNYIWWIRAAGGGRTIIGTGPSIAYKFQDERNYTVFLTVVSASRNAKGKTDVLPFESSVNVNALPQLVNTRLYINGIYVSNLDKIKFSIEQGRAGLLFDASASTPAAGTTFLSAKWSFGNGNVINYLNGPGIERQVYASEGKYRVKLEITTNEGKTATKEIDIEIRTPAAIIKADKDKGYPNEEFRFSGTSNFSSTVESSYEWKVYDRDNTTVLYTSNRKSITYKFPRRGDYTVKLRSVAPNGTEDIDSLVVAVEERDPVAFFETRTISSELPNTVILDATKSYNPDSTAANDLTFKWTVDGDGIELANASRNGALGRYTFNTVGTHSVSLEVVNQEGKTTTYKREMNIDSLLSVKLVTTPKIVMVGSPVTLIAESKEASAFEWQFGDGESDTTTSGRTSHVYKKSGTYDVNLLVRGKGGQGSNSITRKVYVMTSGSPFAVATVRGESDELMPTADACGDKEAYVIDRSKSVTLSADSSVNVDGNNSGLTYTWKYMGRNSSQRSFSYKFDELGCFPVTLTVRSQKTGKVDTARVYVRVDNIAPRLSSLTISPDKLENDPVTVTVAANNAIDEDGAIVAYTWYYYTENDPEPQDFRITRTPKTTFVLPRITGKYYFAVILEDSNGEKVSSEQASEQRYSITLTSDNINTPIITLKSSTSETKVGEKVDFSVSVKNILGNDISSKVEYKWDFNGDGFYEETTSVPNTSHVYDKPGNFNFKVKATYKGISNTKYQMIAVQNDLKPNLEYTAIGKKFVFFNTTKGLYTKVKWSIGDLASSNNSHSFVYDFGEDEVSENVTLEVSDGKDTKSITVALKKDVVNALRLKKSDEQVAVFSYPALDGNEIHVKDVSDKVFLYMGQSKGKISKYMIDTDTDVDTNLNGDRSDDIDNKGTDSFVTGAPFIASNGTVPSKKERTIKLSTYDESNKLIASKEIKIVYDFFEGVTSDETASGSLDAISGDLSDAEKAEMEKLKDLIKGVDEKDRLDLMKYFSSLQENWFDTREKTKIIIDFENAVDTNPNIETKTKEEFYSILEGLLLADTQVKDDVALAVKVLKSLIPKSNPSYEKIMKQIDEILSHPTNTKLNKELGTEILNAIKDDASIENKDKLIIKSQLEVIISGGQNNVIAKQATAPVQTDTGDSLIFVFIVGFLKIFGILLAIIALLFIAGFVYFRLKNTDGNIGFQDFLIEKLFHGGTSGGSTQVSTPPTAPAPSTPRIDPLASVAPTAPEAPVTSAPTMDIFGRPSEPVPVADFMKTSESSESKDVALGSESQPSVPDWLRQATSTASDEGMTTEEPVVESASPFTTPTEPTPFAQETPEIPSTETPMDVSSDVPDWLRAATEVVTPTEEVVTPAVPDSAPGVVETPVEPVPVAETEKLPDWLAAMDQDALQEEVASELAPAPEAPIAEETTPVVSAAPVSDDLPDWLRSASLSSTSTEAVAPEETTIEPIKAAEETSVDTPVQTEVPTLETPEKKHRTKKKATEPVSAESTEPASVVEDAPSKPKKTRAPKQPEPSAPDVALPADQDLPDWLK